MLSVPLKKRHTEDEDYKQFNKIYLFHIFIMNLNISQHLKLVFWRKLVVMLSCV
jgi:hypothetical protein